MAFVIVWGFLLAAALNLLPRWDGQSSFERYELAFVSSLFATFVFELVWLFLREICTSGSRGLLIARLFVSVVFVAAILLAGMYWFGFYTEPRGHIFGFVFTAAAILYVRSRLHRYREWH